MPVAQQSFLKVCYAEEIQIKIVKGGENMAVMLNMLPVETKTNVVVKNSNNTNNTNSTKNGKSETGFAKALTTETDKNATDADSKKTIDDGAQFLAAMAALVTPVVQTPVPVVPEKTNGSDELATMVSTIQNQVVELMVGDDAPKPPAVAESPIPVVTGNELLHSETNAVVTPIVTATVDKATIQQQPPIATGGVVDTKEQQTVAIINTMIAGTPQVTDKQVLDNSGQLQNEMQNAQTVPQLQSDDQQNVVTGISNPTVATAIPTMPLVTANNLLKNSVKLADGKQVSGDQADLEATTGIKKDQVTTLDVQPILATQMTAKVGDEVMSEEKINVITSNQTVKNPDDFASILNQQGMKVEQQTTGAVEAKTVTPQPVADPHNIASQIVNQAHLVAGNKNTEMIIQLKPEHLGELTFKVSVENGVVSASFHSNNAEVRTVIESTLYQLKQEMATQGLKVDTVGVYGGLGEFFSNGQQREGQQQSGAKVPNRKTEEDFFETLEAIDATKSSVDGSGVDYRI